MKRLIASKRAACLIAVLCVMTFSTAVLAEPTSFLSRMFGRKSSMKNQAEVLKVEHGPWLILAGTLTGDNAESKATALATEIRTTLRLPSFIMKKSSGGTSTLGVAERIRTSQSGEGVVSRVEARYANGLAKEAYAVLVGEFSSHEDPRIADALHAIRTAHPIALHPSGKAGESNHADDSTTLIQKTRALFWWQSGRDTNLKKGRMGAAFVIRNPLLPDDFFQAPKMDKFVRSLNKQVEYSLLDCPGRYTVRVASFHGLAKTHMSGVSLASSESETSSTLDIAADQANQLTLALRRKGKEAYQFHDRFDSFVTIGSFDDLGQNSVGGEFQYNRTILAILNEYCGYQFIDAEDPRTGAVSRHRSLKSLDKIPFDIEGKPMAVPRPETSRIYSGSLLGNR